MAFKIKPPYNMDNTPIYFVSMEDGVLGKANRNGTIIVNENASPAQLKEILDHEMVHIHQMKRGDLDYDDKYVYWKGEKYPRASMKEGNKTLPWEKEAWG